MDQSRRKDPILVLAKRNVVRIKRKDSGLDLGFDEPDAVAKPKLKGRVKWGRHPIASSWLIPTLFVLRPTLVVTLLTDVQGSSILRNWQTYKCWQCYHVYSVNLQRERVSPMRFLVSALKYVHNCQGRKLIF